MNQATPSPFTNALSSTAIYFFALFFVGLSGASTTYAHDPAAGTPVTLRSGSGETDLYAYEWTTVAMDDTVLAEGIPYARGYETLPMTRGVASSYMGRFHSEAHPEPHTVLLTGTELVYTVEATDDAGDFLCAVLIPWEEFMNDSSSVPDTLRIALDDDPPADIPVEYVHGGYFALNTGARAILSCPLVLALDLPPGEHEVRIVGSPHKFLRYRLIVGAVRAMAPEAGS